MSKRTTKILASSLSVALVASMVTLPSVASAATSTQLAGLNRYETSLEIVQAGWDSADNVIIASGESNHMADSLAAAPLAYKMGEAPILLTKTDSIPAGVLTELKELGVKTITIVGGEAAVSKEVEAELKLEGVTVNRVSGANRFETSLAIAKEAFGTDYTDVVIANGLASADALSVSAIAANKGMPILLVNNRTGLTTEQSAYIAGKTKYAIGGTTVLSDAVVGTATRLSGANRYETNAAILAKFAPDYSKIFLAKGTEANLVDALVGSAYAAKGNNPIVLVDSQEGINAKLITELTKNISANSEIVRLGGKVTASAVNAVEAVKSDAVVGVKSVSAINANQISVTFDNEEVATVDLTEALVDGDNEVTFEVDGVEYTETVTYVAPDTEAPVLSVDGETTVSLENGAKLVLPTVTATDNKDETVVVTSVITNAAGDVVEAIDTIVAGTYTVTYSAVDTAENDAETVVVTVVVAEKVLVVESVSAINASQLLVSFTQEVDETTAENVSSYDVTGNTIASAVLQKDNKSVIVNLGTPVTTSTAVAVTVKNILLATDASVLLPLYTQVITINDEVAPDVDSIASTTNTSTATSLKIKFTEPLASIPAIKIDGITISSGVTPSFDATTGVTVLNLTGLSLDAATSHSLQVVNAVDTAANVNSLINKTFSVVIDKVAPQVASVAQYSDDTIIVKFDKNINSATVAANIAVADSNLNTVGIAAVVVDSVDSKTFEVKLDNSGFYATTTTNNLTVLFKNGILDTVGNAITAVTKSITLNQDTVAPNVTGVVVNKNAAGDTTGIKVSFDSKLDNSFTPDLNKISVVNSNGVIDSSTFNFTSATVNYGDSSVTLNMTPAPATLTGKYGFTFGETFEKDLSIAKNASNTYSKVIDFGTATSSATWKLASTQSSINSAIDSSTPGTIIVTFPGAVKGGAVVGSATNPINYTLNGSTLPTGTTITLDNLQTVATITLPDGSVAATDSSAVFAMTNIQRTSDSLPIAVTTATISVTDNTAPVLLSAKVLDNKHVVLTYSEAMASTLGNVGTEFQLSQAGNVLTFTDSELTAARLSGYTSQVTLTIAQGSDSAATLGTAEVNTLTAAAATSAGNITVSFNDGTIVSQVVAVATSDTQTIVATKIAAAFASLTGYTVTSVGTDVVFTATAPAADKTVTVTVVDTDTTGVGTLSSSETTKGVAPTAATTGTVLDLNQILTVKALAPTSTIDMIDASTGNNQQAASVSAITITK